MAGEELVVVLRSGIFRHVIPVLIPGSYPQPSSSLVSGNMLRDSSSN